MIDALLYAIRDCIRTAIPEYDYRTCDIRDDGQPPPRCGNVYVAVHQGPERSVQNDSLSEYFSFRLTLTMRVVVPIDRIGDQLLAIKLAKSVGWNRRADDLKTLLHMNWGALQDANNNLVELHPNAGLIYGFCEPARYRGRDNPTFVGADWFASSPDAADMGLKGELKFEDCRRIQAIAHYV